MCNKFEIVESFRIEKEIKVKKSTVKTYCTHINIFLNDIGDKLNSADENVILNSLKKFINIQSVICQYRKRTELPKNDKRRFSYSTVNTKIFALKEFGDFLAGTGEFEKNPFMNINPYESYEVERNKEHHKSLSLEETRKLIKTINKMEKNNLKKSRLKFIIAMMTNCGNRIGELINLTFDQIEGTKDGIMINYIGKNATKKGVDKRIPITGKAKEYYLDYLRERNKIIDNIKSNSCEKYVLVSDKGKKYNHRRVNEALEKYCFIMGVDIKKRKITNHGFRGTCRIALDCYKGVGEGTIKLIQGWQLDSVQNAYLSNKLTDKDKMEICNIL